MFAAVLFAALLQDPVPSVPPVPAPAPQTEPPAPPKPDGNDPKDEDAADKAFRAEITTERMPFEPVLVTPKRVATADVAEQRKVVAADSTVVGVVVGGEARAYPIDLVGSSESLNDTLGGTPLLVTWCVRCQAAIVYSRKVGEQVLTFGSQRALYRGSALLYDVETGSLWSQPMGRAGCGPLRERELAPLTSSLTTWASWRAEHPDTTVLIGPAARRFQRSSFYVWDPKATLKLGIVVRVGAAAKLYPAARAENEIALFVDDVAGEPVVVVFSPERQLLAAYRRGVQGKSLDFEVEAPADGPLLLKEKGGERRWRADTGQAVAPAEPAAKVPPLERLVAHPLTRARFADFFPKGVVYSEDATPPPEAPRKE
jgi:hypothetical protein